MSCEKGRAELSTGVKGRVATDSYDARPGSQKALLSGAEHPQGDSQGPIFAPREEFMDRGMFPAGKALLRLYLQKSLASLQGLGWLLLLRFSCFHGMVLTAPASLTSIAFSGARGFGIVLQ